jgi:hypothetical protein
VVEESGATKRSAVVPVVGVLPLLPVGAVQ